MSPPVKWWAFRRLVYSPDKQSAIRVFLKQNGKPRKGGKSRLSGRRTCLRKTRPDALRLSGLRWLKLLPHREHNAELRSAGDFRGAAQHLDVQVLERAQLGTQVAVPVRDDLAQVDHVVAAAVA